MYLNYGKCDKWLSEEQFGERGYREAGLVQIIMMFL